MRILSLLFILCSFGAYGQSIGTAKSTLRVLGRLQIDSTAGGDTTNYKPMGISSTGAVRRVPYWPVGVGGMGGASVWGGIAGTLANQTDLAAALASKAALSHTHAISDVTSLQATLDAKALSGHTHSNATTSGAGFMSAADKTKLDGVATGATANSSDATLLARSNHTGSQTAATISDFSTAADARITNAIGATVQAHDADLDQLAIGNGSALNLVAAHSLKSATTNVVVSAATAPTAGQVLTATSANAATWQTPSGGGGGSGTVNSGTQYRLAYYGSTGTAVSQSAIATNASNELDLSNGTAIIRGGGGAAIFLNSQAVLQESPGNYLGIASGAFSVSNGAVSQSFIIDNLGNTRIGPNFPSYGSLTVNATTTPSNDIAFKVGSEVAISSGRRGSQLRPKMTQAQRTGYTPSEVGVEVYQTDGTEGVYVYKSSGWVFAY